MKFHDLLNDVFGSPVRTKVFTLFMKFPAKTFSGREVARMCGISAMAAWHAIKAFEAQGVIHRSRVGKTDSLKLNPEHFLAKKLGGLAGIDDAAVAEMKAILLETLPKNRLIRLYLYGSCARSEERPTSDIDVLAIVKRAEDKKAVTDASGEAALRIIDSFGNALSLIAFTEAEFKSDANLFKEVKKDGRVLFERSKNHG